MQESVGMVQSDGVAEEVDGFYRPYCRDMPFSHFHGEEGVRVHERQHICKQCLQRMPVALADALELLRTSGC